MCLNYSVFFLLYRLLFYLFRFRLLYCIILYIGYHMKLFFFLVLLFKRLLLAWIIYLFFYLYISDQNKYSFFFFFYRVLYSCEINKLKLLFFGNHNDRWPILFSFLRFRFGFGTNRMETYIRELDNTSIAGSLATICLRMKLCFYSCIFEIEYKKRD